jgi:hypothetical protein
MLSQEVLDLSGKSTEELTSLYTEFYEKNKILHEEKNKLDKESHLIKIRIKTIDNKLNLILKEIKINNDIEDLKNMIGEKERNIEDFELLSERELTVITTKMDKTDYRYYGEYPRWLDLERIIKEVIFIKKCYPKWILTNLSRKGKTEIIPPKTFYIYEFTDDFGTLFDVGGIILS